MPRSFWPMPMRDAIDIRPALKRTAQVLAAAILCASARPALADRPECAVTAQLELTQPRSSTFADVIAPSSDTEATFVLSCAGVIGSFSYDLGLRVHDDDDPELRVRNFKLGLDVGSEGFLILGYHPQNTDPSFTIQPIGLFGDSADYSTFIDRTFERESAPMARFEYYGGSVTYASTFSRNMRHDLDSLQWVNSLAFSVGNTDAQVMLRYDDELGAGFGAAFSTIIGSNIELHGSAFAQKGSARHYHADAMAGAFQLRGRDDSPLGRLRLDSDDLVPRIVIGGHYTFQKGDNFLLELVHDGEGMSKSEWDRYVDIVDFHRTAAAPIAARAGNLGFDLLLLGKTNMQNYAFTRYSFGQSAANLSMSALFNLDDGSARFTADAVYVLSDYAELFGNVSVGTGCRTCEFGLLPERYSAHLGISYHF